MNYSEALSYIHGALKFGIKLGLENIRHLLNLMGNPQDKLRFVHIGGTNGKGSTTAFISSILIEAGYKTGIYTSPYIERFTERMKINNTEISEDDLARITGFVKEKIEIMVENRENHPTEFEIVTAIAFQYFYESGCDVVVLEVGLGGRFDSTNVIETPVVSVITTISYDHMDRLGNTLREIAFEKAGIIKDNGCVVIYPQSEEVNEVFEEACRIKGAKLHKFDFGSIKFKSYGIDGQEFEYEGYGIVKISLLGDHQIFNAVVAINTIEAMRNKGFRISESALKKGLAEAKWPGRLEIIRKNPLFIIDGAHNAEGAQALCRALKKYFPGKRITFITGIFKDKDYKAIIEAAIPIAQRFIAVSPTSERALPAAELGFFISSYCNEVSVSDTIDNAIETSFRVTSADDIICAYGSLHFIGEIRGIMNTIGRKPF